MFVLFILSLFVSPWISFILHEMGHVLAGLSVKMEIQEIRLGRGPIIFRGRWSGTEIIVGLIPLGGRVTGVPKLRYAKAARLLFIAGGPVMDLAWFAILIVALRFSSDAVALRVVLFPALAFQVPMIYSNLMPHYSTLYGKRMANDMLALWQTVWPKVDYLAMHRQLYLNALRPYAGIEEPALSRQSDRIAYLLLELNSLIHRQPEQQIVALEHELSIAPSRSEQLLIMESISMHVLANEGLRDNAYLDRLTQKALLLAPELATLKGTRGAALARFGRHEEALALLAEADDSNDTNRCLNAAFRGLAHFHAGRKDQATVELEISTAIVQSQNWTNVFAARIVDSVIAEISHVLLEPRKNSDRPTTVPNASNVT
ncbi:site-2 protease family protein (plasmid) [Rhizobium sp. CB3171]|uniref:site-2 protease family protein n=1 Tax=unclassified Rhizobium TaxID=2613769 RepID=UPI0021A55894|nr:MULTISPECIES: site-2 protease family protein [Rhizobium]UWU24220.1 site-2 protease family protein [Rhizobium tropici]WFU05148.1 site-2 protease family protein [Rhizobium sp. CB3171]